MATKLIEEISKNFGDDYKSNYEEALKELIQAKIQNKEIEEPDAAPRTDNVVDLMEALQRSLNASKVAPTMTDTGMGTEARRAAGTETGPAATPTPRRRRKV
jgi:DNA end-binding protein Ku